MLKRCAAFLRVVEEKGTFDALDQPTDTPKPTEKIFAYRLKERPGMCHVRASGGRGGFYPMATYQFIDNQPEDAVMRNGDQWRQWCESQAK